VNRSRKRKGGAGSACAVPRGRRLTNEVSEGDTARKTGTLERLRGSESEEMVLHSAKGFTKTSGESHGSGREKRVKGLSVFVGGRAYQTPRKVLTGKNANSCLTVRESLSREGNIRTCSRGRLS